MKIDITTFDLEQIPSEENDNFEFKSSRVTIPELKKKIGYAVSGFANAGGGYFIAGVDSDGNADGGIPQRVGKQDMRDWIDQVISEVQPVPKYDIILMPASLSRGHTHPDNAVVVIAVHESYIGPHMAPDSRYYIRAGAHTVTAKHFIVDAIWAKRHVSKPRLTHSFRLRPDKPQVIQLGVIALTNAPAIDVKITISPLPWMMEDLSAHFPLQISAIDTSNPFFFDVVTHANGKSMFGENLQLEVEYLDLANNTYTYRSTLNLTGQIPPINFKPDTAKAVDALEALNKAVLSLANSVSESLLDLSVPTWSQPSATYHPPQADQNLGTSATGPTTSDL